MAELIIFLGIWYFVKTIKRAMGEVKKENRPLEKSLRERVSEKIPENPFSRENRPSARPNQPRREQMKFPWAKDAKEDSAYTYKSAPPAPKKRPSVQDVKDRGQDIMNKVNQHIYGTDASKADLLLYKNYLETKRQTDIRKMAREMECTMYQVISDIRDFQKMGYFSNVEIDDTNYVIRYTDRPAEQKRSTMHAKSGAQASQQREADPIKAHEVHGSASVKLTDCEDCGTAPESRTRKNQYMTMPAHGLEIGYMTMTEDYTVGYMTMPEGGMDIGYNTMPDIPEE